MLKVIVRLLLVLMAALIAGLFSAFVNTSNYVQFAMWAALLATLSLTLMDSGFSILQSTLSGTLYSTIYVVTHGLLEIYAMHKHETLAGWALMLVVYNLTTVLSVWFFLKKVNQWEQSRGKQQGTKE
ncbi:hypothetical protein [Alicyclobacillus ferrooxydans]|uniref:DUF3021 domain-containing protein n=1 Tax=Alicyclobacillus ferrooxydans TaxID=471514 RepID=A0A0P9CQP8_9BACL|nr:hypothetical protein [Alicyclobacillus ferrooxydans]KPV45202.1 hypothetical protein AN477_03420 [Alicyclobacillus ferrooxydans]